MIPVMYAVFSFLFDIQMRLEIIVLRERVVMHEEEEEEEVEEEEEEDVFPAPELNANEEEHLAHEFESVGAADSPMAVDQNISSANSV